MKGARNDLGRVAGFVGVSDANGKIAGETRSEAKRWADTGVTKKAGLRSEFSDASKSRVL
jgi:hypothetical protein